MAYDPSDRGIIVMWSGRLSNIPAGWVLCNGSNGTPDLRNKFICGASQDQSNQAQTNVSGSFVKSGGALLAEMFVGYSSDLADSNHDGATIAVVADPSPPSIQATGNVLPPYYALVFIMKT